MEACTYVVAIESNVQLAVADSGGVYLLSELLHDAVRKIDAARLDADEHRILEVKVIFQQLMGQALYRDLQLLFIQDRLQRRNFYKK